MTYKIVGLLIVLFLCCTCSTLPKPQGAFDLINTSHLEHLYQEIQVGSEQLGTIWIYCEAPDYEWVADEDEGFTCVDDVARALVFYCKQHKRQPSPMYLEKIQRLTAYILHLRADNGYFYNFMFPDHTINTSHQNSLPIANWWSWRAFWALSEIQSLREPKLDHLRPQIDAALDALFTNLSSLCTHPEKQVVYGGIDGPACLEEMGADQMSVLLIGLTNYYQHQPSTAVEEVIQRFGTLLQSVQLGTAATFPYRAFMSWRNHWHGWGNLQAYALLYAGRVLSVDSFIQSGLQEVDYFYPYVIQTGFMHAFDVTRQPEQERFDRGAYQQFPQIAYDIRPMVYAAQEAYEITEDPAYATTAGQLVSWFFGNNPGKQQMYDPSTGRCFDGLTSPTAVNGNSGAESTIEALLSLQAIAQNPIAKTALKPYLDGKLRIR